MIFLCRPNFRQFCALVLIVTLLASGATVRSEQAPLPGERPEGTGVWVDLLDTGLRDWVVEKKLSGEHVQPAGVWTVAEDRVLRCDGRGFGFLRYDRVINDFVFSCEYRLAPGANSGIGIRGVPYLSTIATRPSRASYELQIFDEVGTTNVKGNMSLYKHLAPTSNPSKPGGEWNRVVVACRGALIRVWLNGALVQDVDQREHASIRDKPLSGYLQLQNHHSVVAFRNLRLFVVGNDKTEWPQVTPSGQVCFLAKP